jgi:polysaccharide biosynthesis transport protein
VQKVITRQQYEQIKAQADNLNDKAVEFSIVRQDAVESRSLYEDLLKRLKEAGVLEGLKSSNITVVDPGRTPAKPKSPNILLYMAVALSGGFFFGCCGGLLVDTLDNKIKNVTDLEQTTGKDVLGALPLFFDSEENRNSVIFLRSPMSPYPEAIRTIRTSLMLSRKDHPPKSILVTSAIAGEGKSTFSINLATALAQQGRQVLLIDTDLRRGVLAKRFVLSSGRYGLSSLLSGIDTVPKIDAVPKIKNLHVLLAGPVPPNPSELLDSQALRTFMEKWREKYDYVILDGAPVLPVTDSLILNELVDATMLVSRADLVEKAQVKRGFSLLSHNGEHFVGVILNGIRENDRSYYGYYGYYGHHGKSGYGYKEDHDA